MSNLQQIKTDDLDFDAIKQNLKNYLSTQANFKDYNFEGSVMSTIVDLLAYNTHYNSLYTNLAINESFIDSASKRASLVSLAKLMGYTPKSVTSSKAVVTLNISTPQNTYSNVLTLPAYTKFTSNNNGTLYTFSTVEDVTSYRIADADPFIFTNLTLVEGVLTSITYNTGDAAIYVIPEPTVDTGTLRVKVYNPINGATDYYNFANSIVGTTITDKVYFIKQREDLYYEVYFGDGIFGVAVNPGNIITLSYMISSGDAANGCNTFSYSGGYDANLIYSFQATIPSAHGAPEESKDSIRYYAPMVYQSQDRIVTANDYESALVNEFPDIEIINVWGGQDNIPPEYGKVFIAAKPYGRNNFSEKEKNLMLRGIVSRKNVLTVTPVFVDLRYLDIEIISSVYYDPKKTINASGDILSIVKNVIANYGNTLSGESFRYSKLTGFIDLAEPSIVSNITTVRVRTEITPKLNINDSYIINFGNPIAHDSSSTFYSTRFFVDGITERCYLKNNNTIIELYKESTDGTPQYMRNVGTLSYDGSIVIDSLLITNLYDTKLEFVFYPDSYDVIPPNNYIIRMPLDKITVNMLVDSLSQNRSAKTDHIFSSSR